MILTSTLIRKGVALLQSDFPHELLTGLNSTPLPRMRVDVAQTGFFEGREWRAFWDGNIAAGATQVIKLVSTVNFIVFEQSFDTDNSTVVWSTYQGGTEGGTFSTGSIGKFRKNEMTDAPAETATSLVLLSTGGTHTGGTQRDIARKVSTVSGQSATTIGGTVADERGIAPGTYYIRLQNTGAQAANVTYKLFWEERP